LTLVANISLWRYRLNHPKWENNYQGFDDQQVERLKLWNQLKRLSLTNDNIVTFVDNTLKKQTLDRPPHVMKVDFNSLEQGIQDDFRDAFFSFVKAYSDNTAQSAFVYHTQNRGGAMDHLIKQQLLDIYKKVSKKSLPNSDLELFSFFWNINNDRGIHWKNILDKSGMISIWSTNSRLTQEQESFINSYDKSVFHGQSVLLNIFRCEEDITLFFENKKKVIFGDVFFVAELDETRNGEFLPVTVRFYFNEKSQKWFPVSLVIVVPSKQYNFTILF
jgi:hypothetical protein